MDRSRGLCPDEAEVSRDDVGPSLSPLRKIGSLEPLVSFWKVKTEWSKKYINLIHTYPMSNLTLVWHK